jgi:ribose-phosphate pyrophosphokinase
MSTFQINFPEDNGTKYISFRYPAGEYQVSLTDETADLIKKADRVIVFARIQNGEIMELAQLTSALKTAVELTQAIDLVLPYLPYGRADRRFSTAHDCFGLLTFMKQINILNYDNVYSLDVHSKQAEEFGIININPAPLLDSIILDRLSPVTILLPDSTGIERYKMPALFCKKHVLSFTVPDRECFKTKNVLIVGDICDGGEEFISIANAMKDYGLNLNLYATHGLFSKGLDELSKYFDRIFMTDSYRAIHQSRLKGTVLTQIPCYDTILASIQNSGDGQ